MLDLNAHFLHEDEKTALPEEVEESSTSNSSLVNACSSSNFGKADDDSVSAAGDGDSFHCFDFDILTVGDTGALLSNRNSNSNDEDRTSQAESRSEFVTRTLFPISNGDGRLNLGHQQVNSLQLFPDNNGSLEKRLLQAPQIKPTVEQNQVGKRSRRGPRSRSSQYRGVTFYRRTGRWESHIWDCGKQVYLGGFDTAHAAARAYDRAAIRFRGVNADINFNIIDYDEDMNQIKDLSKEDFVRILRRHSSGFSRGGSKHRGATMNTCVRWDPQTGLLLGKKAYGNAAMESNGREAITNVETVASHYGTTHSLDLNLGISTSWCFGKGSSRNGNLEHIQLNHGLHDIRRLQADNPARTTLKGLPVISEHGQSLMGMRPTFFPSFEGPSNWAWQLHCQSQTPTKLCTAASSGFPPTDHDQLSFSVSTNDYNHQKRPPLSPPPP